MLFKVLKGLFGKKSEVQATASERNADDKNIAYAIPHVNGDNYVGDIDNDTLKPLEEVNLPLPMVMYMKVNLKSTNHMVMVK